MKQQENNTWSPDSLLTNQEAADLLRVTVRTLYAWRKSGEIVWRNIGGVRFLYRDLTEFAQRRAMVPVER